MVSHEESMNREPVPTPRHTCAPTWSPLSVEGRGSSHSMRAVRSVTRVSLAADHGGSPLLRCRILPQGRLRGILRERRGGG